MTARTILWRRLDGPGHEAARLTESDAGYQLAGSAAFAHDGEPCRLDYVVACDVGWRTVATRVTGWVGAAAVDIAITVDPRGRWWMNDRECPAVAGCADIDLNFSPSTNLLPIRRLNLEIGGVADVRAAWLRFPSFALEPFDQRYSRRGPTTYRYVSASGFQADLEVNEVGFATRYAGIWEADALG